MQVEKAKIGNIIYDVATYDEYSRNPNIYNNFTALIDGEYLYPIRNKTDTRPGIYPTGPFIFYVNPTEEEQSKYSINNIISFSKCNDIRDVIETQEKISNSERAILTTIDNVFVPEIGENNTPEMKGLKTAIIAKHIDIDKYESRFGDNFHNDIRLLKRDSITMSKIKTMMSALDMKGTLIIEDSSPNVPNPIGRKIIVELHSDGDDISDESN